MHYFLKFSQQRVFQNRIAGSLVEVHKRKQGRPSLKSTLTPIDPESFL